VHRVEWKYAVGVAAAAYLRQEIGRHLPLFEFETGEPVTYITTIYFDTTANHFYEEAERSYDDHLKIRVKEYTYPVRPTGSLPSASRLSGGEPQFRISPDCFVELKEHQRGKVIKKRLRIPKKLLSTLFAGGDIWPAVRERGGGEDPERLRAVYDELRESLRVYDVKPSSVISYRRAVFQRSEGELRVTFDDEITVYSPPAELYDRHPALTPEVLGPPTLRGDKVILEIKHPGQLPPWLEQALRHESSQRLSKFTTSVRALKPLSSGTSSWETDTGIRKQAKGMSDTQDLKGGFY
jgi:hypothetical protein